MMNKLYSIIILVILATNSLNAQQVSYITSYDHIYDEATYHDDTRVLNKTLQVGSLPGNVEVNPVGSATYTIPISTPVGVGGMQPSLVLTYNSNGGDGLMGIGWSLAGASSAIGRIPKSLQIDGIREKVNFDNSDALALDGQRLIPDPADQTMAWGNGKIFWLQGNPTTKGYFSVGDNSWTFTDAGGKTMVYGSSSESRLDNSGVTFQWLLKSVSDPNGNTITYNYSKDNTDLEIHLTNIEYTSNGSHAATNKIEFVYGTRSDVLKQRTNKGLFKSSLLLTAINMMVNDELACKYQFNYIKSDIGISALSEVEKQDGTGKALNTTRFQWQQPKKEITYSAVQTFGGRITFTGDFNADGITDLLDSIGNVAYGSSTGQFNVARIQNLSALAVGDFDGDGITEIANSDNAIYTIANNALQYVKALPEGLYFVVSDYNQDGVPDFIFEDGNVYSADNLAQIAISNVDMSIFKGLQADIDGDGDTENVVITGDINVEQKWFSHGMDIYNNVVSIYNKLNIFNSDYEWITESACDIFYDEIQSYCNAIISYAYQDDVPGYSSDIVNYIADIRTAAGSLKYEVQANGGSYGNFVSDLGSIESDMEYIISAIQQQTVVTTDTRNYEIYHFDQNTKIYYKSGMYPMDEQQLAGAWASDSDGFEKLQFFNIDWTQLGKDNPTQVTGDFDGDGIEDRVVINQGAITISNVSSYTESINVLKNWNLSLHTDVIGRYMLDYLKEHKLPNNYLHVGDFNGDGIDELLAEGNNFEKTLISYATGNGQMRIVGASNGLNQKTRIKYESMNNPGIYTSSTGKKPGILLNLVSQVQVQNGDGNFITTNYTYTDAISNPGVQGFLGFTKVTAETPLLDTKIENITQYGTTNQWISPIAASNGITDKLWFADNQTTNVYKASSMISTSTNSFSIIEKNNSYKQLPTTTTANDWLTGNSSTTNYTYNTIAEVETIKTTFNDGSYKQVTYAGYFKDVLPTLITTRQKHFQDANYAETKVSNTYDNNLRLTQTINNYGIVDKQVTTTFSNFDEFGHALTQTTTATSIADMVSTITYDPTGRFLLTKANWQGSETYTYNSLMGTISSKTDVYGNVTNYTYNSFGQLTNTTNPDGTVETSSVAWDPGDGPANALYYTHATKTGSPWMKTWYDIVGRKLKEESIGFSNLSMYTLYIYNTDGSLQSSSQYTGTNLKSTSYTYFSDGRLQKETYSSGKIVSYEYSGLTVSSVINDKRYTKTTDCMGNMLNSTEPAGGGNITYSYNSFLKPVQISAANATTSMTYDAVGNQLTLNDPSSGTTQYTYDGASRIKTQTDARGQLQENFYDDYGRIDHVQAPDGTTSYQYVLAGNGKGKVSRLTAPNGTYTEYSYDYLGRAINKKDHIDGRTFESAYTFESDRIVSIQAVGLNLQKQLGYDQYGNLTQIGLNNRNTTNTLWSLTQSDALTKKCTLGNGVTTEEQFDANGFQTLSKASLGGNVIQDLAYSFDPLTANLTWRADNRAGYNLKETFSYDDLDRLTSNTVLKNNVQTYQNTITYATNGSGNITHKTGVGNYEYDAARPYTAARITDPEEALNIASQQASYTWFNKVETVIEGDNRQEFTYGPDHERLKSVLYKNNAVVRTRYYTGYGQIDIDANGTEVEKLLVRDDKGDIFAEVSPNGGMLTIHYMHSDYQGSLLAVTDANGALLAEQSFDPWGRRRNPTDWTFTSVPAPSTLFARGYTGHEHMDEFGLINMNGRLYDPVLGSFLSPDPYVQAPGMSLSYNRYSYCLNNPLKYTDPSGYRFNFSIGSLFDNFKNSLFGDGRDNQQPINHVAQSIGFNNAKSLAICMAEAFAINLAATLAGQFIGGLIAPEITTFWQGFKYGLSSGFTRGFINGSVGSWLFGGQNFQRGLENGLQYGWREGSTDAINYGLGASGGKMNLFQILVVDNMGDNTNITNVNQAKLHAFIGGYDFGNQSDYWIWSKNISNEQRLDMAFETFYGLSIVKDINKKIPYNRYEYVPNRCYGFGSNFKGHMDIHKDYLKIFLKTSKIAPPADFFKSLLYPFWYDNAYIDGDK